MLSEKYYQAAIQAPICPFCCDNHSSSEECDQKELKKEFLKLKLEAIFEYSPSVDKEKAKHIYNLVSWL